MLVKDGGYVSGLWEDWAVGMHIWREKMVRERKSDRNNSSFDHGVMKGLSEGAKCGDYVQAERWGGDQRGRTVVGVTTTRGSFRRRWRRRW